MLNFQGKACVYACECVSFSSTSLPYSSLTTENFSNSHFLFFLLFVSVLLFSRAHFTSPLPCRGTQLEFKITSFKRSFTTQPTVTATNSDKNKRRDESGIQNNRAEHYSLKEVNEFGEIGQSVINIS